MLDFHLQYALHTTSFEEQPLSDKTLSRFRKRCYEQELLSEQLKHYAEPNDFNQVIPSFIGYLYYIKNCDVFGGFTTKYMNFSRYYRGLLTPTSLVLYYMQYEKNIENIRILYVFYLTHQVKTETGNETVLHPVFIGYTPEICLTSFTIQVTVNKIQLAF